MNQEFVQHALGHGEEGKLWLKRIPDIIAQAEKEWHVKVLSPFNLSYNYVAPALREDGTETVVKIGYPKDGEFRTEIEALAVFKGQGAEKLLEVNDENAVILLERVFPGIPLSSIGDDEESTRILASVIKKLHKPLPPENSFIPISKWMRAIPQYKEKYRDNGPLPSRLIETAEDLFEELIASSSEPVLVHGDLHQDNILSSNRDGWLAIDPKGIAAEPAYETAAMIRNPYKKMTNYSVSELQDILRKRILILSKELQFDPKRIHKWCLAQTVLSAVWNDGGVKGSGHAVKIAEILNSLKI